MKRVTKMIGVSISVRDIDPKEGEEWANEMVNVYADMEISDVKTTGSSISFKAGRSGMDDTTPDDIRQKIDEYLTMNEAFSVQDISCG